MILHSGQLAPQRTRRPGFTLIELAVVISIIAILAAALLNRVLFYQEQAEKAAMQQMVGTLRSALHIQIAKLLVKGRENEIFHLQEQNPMSWLAERPGNYLGEYDSPQLENIVSGNWFFDLHSRNLIYLVNNDTHFHSAKGERNQIRFQVRVIKSTSGDSANTEKPTNNIEGVVLDQVVSYRWF